MRFLLILLVGLWSRFIIFATWQNITQLITNAAMQRRNKAHQAYGGWRLLGAQRCCYLYLCKEINNSFGNSLEINTMRNDMREWWLRILNTNSLLLSSLFTHFGKVWSIMSPSGIESWSPSYNANSRDHRGGLVASATPDLIDQQIDKLRHWHLKPARGVYWILRTLSITLLGDFHTLNPLPTWNGRPI